LLHTQDKENEMSVTLFGGNQDIELKFWTFPGGERNVKIVNPIEIKRFRSFTIRCDYRSSDDLIDVMLLVNACRNVDGNVRLRLLMPYFPAARQDRVMTEGEPFALQVIAQLINSCNFDQVEVWDPHSDVLAGMFPAGNLLIRPQWELAERWADQFAPREVCFVSPDAGALKKIYKLAKAFNRPVIEATKVRDVTTGEITRTDVQYAKVVDGGIFVVVDDICDGGRTFIELAAAIRSQYEVKELILVVTHGIFSKGKEVLSAYDKVFAFIDWTK
jgi:ribose-phosphate pyrophosphokinase